MDPAMITKLLTDLFGTAIVYYLMTQRLADKDGVIADKDKTIDRLQKKLDECEAAEDMRAEKLADFYQANQLHPPLIHQKETEVVNSGSQ